jgi:hypothetical protein
VLVLLSPAQTTPQHTHTHTETTQRSVPAQAIRRSRCSGAQGVPGQRRGLAAVG